MSMSIIGSLSPAADAPSVSRPTNTRIVMAGVLLALLLASLDQMVVATAMPKIITSLQGFSQYAWVTTIYMLASTVTVPIYGELSDILGRKAIFLFGIAVFLIGSALSGTAQTMTALILFRGLQGLGAGAMVPISLAIVGDLFPPKERGKIQGLTGAVSGVSSMAAYAVRLYFHGMCPFSGDKEPSKERARRLSDAREIAQLPGVNQR
jgi:MFS family permease